MSIGTVEGMSTDEAEYVRQEQIWASLYGPPTAAELIAKARTMRETDTSSPIREIFAAAEPEEDGDIEEAGTMRPI